VVIEDIIVNSSARVHGDVNPPFAIHDEEARASWDAKETWWNHTVDIRWRDPGVVWDRLVLEDTLGYSGRGGDWDALLHSSAEDCV
jgi:hypothetical protein